MRWMLMFVVAAVGCTPPEAPGIGVVEEGLLDERWWQNPGFPGSTPYHYADGHTWYDSDIGGGYVTGSYVRLPVDANYIGDWTVGPVYCAGGGTSYFWSPIFQTTVNGLTTNWVFNHLSGSFLGANGRTKGWYNGGALVGLTGGGTCNTGYPTFSSGPHFCNEMRDYDPYTYWRPVANYTSSCTGSNGNSGVANPACAISPTDPCRGAGLGDGEYCGVGLPGGDPAVLYHCVGPRTAGTSRCACGCMVNPPRTNDACHTGCATDMGGATDMGAPHDGMHPHSHDGMLPISKARELGSAMVHGGCSAAPGAPGTPGTSSFIVLLVCGLLWPRRRLPRELAGVALLAALASVAGCASADRSPLDAAVIDGPAHDLARPDAGPPPHAGDPTTCAEAAASKSYVGCEYWPTVLTNPVWSIFDFAVVVANPQAIDATVTVTGPQSTNQTVTVRSGQLEKIYLPWVPELKGPDSNNCVAIVEPTGSVRKAGGAYHLVSSVPVTVYQFNALEYHGQGGPPGKDWSSCPGNQICLGPGPFFLQSVGCYSFTNDASLLLPEAALTGTYRITGFHGQGAGSMSPYFAVTGLTDGTMVTVHVSATGQILAGGGLVATPPGGLQTFQLNAGDVVEVMGAATDASDLSGTLVSATHPVQVMNGVPCINNPLDKVYCDHLEASNFPAETLGSSYVVTVPTGPFGTPVGHTVRLYGNFDGTHLTYEPPLAGAPQTLHAGQVVDLGVVKSDFHVKGDQAFAVGTFMLAGSMVDPGTTPLPKGDPSSSLAVAVEQFRSRYIFLAPDDYDASYIDVVLPVGATLTLDGVKVTASPSVVGASGFAVVRVALTRGNAGAHTLAADRPVGLQVMGYGAATSYQYPGGLDLNAIAPPPIQ